MAKKKQTKKVEVEEPQIQEEVAVVEVPQVEKPEAIERLKPKNEWEIKDRVYYLTRNKKPLSKIIKTANVYYFDEEKGYERELKYCENQRTCFVDEMHGDQRMSHVIFRNGSLFVPREKQTLQKLMSLYHPHRDKLFYEWKPDIAAEKEIDILEVETDAL